MRLFFAVELPSEVQSALGRLRPAEDNRDYRWSEPELLHITLVFLGEQPPETLPRLEAAAQRAARASHPGTLHLGQPNTFGSPRAPRVLLVALDGDLDALRDLAGNLERELRADGFRLQDRPYRPHITLARRRASARGGPPQGWPPRRIPRTQIPLRKVTLFESRLSPRGPSYMRVAGFAVDAAGG